MKRLLLLVVMVAAHYLVNGQCTLIDGQGLDSGNPVWVSCSGADFTLFIQSNDTYGNFTVDWGDGSPLFVGTSLVPPAFITHTYTAAVANYTVTFDAPGDGCNIVGTVVMEEPVNASIQIPLGGVTQICAPGDMDFTNASTDVSSNTTFTWDFGDGSPPLVLGDTNLGQTVTHTYLQGTVDCNTQVTLEAENFCSFGNPTIASFNPILIYDLDDAEITASAILLCYPDTVVHFDNTTNRNCVPEGNVDQRYEYWNFGNYWGTGQDSIIDWQPFLPPARPGYDIAFPGVGTYTIMMADSNQCGTDTAFITIQIVDRPTAAVAASIDTICEGESITFSNNSVGANSYSWDFGDGGGFSNFNGNGGNMTHTYNTAGAYTVTLVATINGGQGCLDTAMVDIFVKPSPTADINLTPDSGCDSLTVTFTDNSTNDAVIWSWSFGNGQASVLQNPPIQQYNTSGSFNVNLVVTSSNGCTDQAQETVNVYESPVIGITPTNVCENTISQFFDNSTVGFGGPINDWIWDFGDGNGSTQQNPMHTYTANGTYDVALTASTNFCSSTDTLTVTVEPQPIPSFLMDTTSGCSPLPVTFTNTTTGAVTYDWTFGDGNTSTQTSPTHTYINNSGVDVTHTIQLVATTTFGCKDSITATVDVFPNPIGGFTSDAVADCAPLIVNFTDNSTGAVSWDWDFGDTTGSTLQNPTKTFINNTQFITNYTVTQIAFSNNGCTDTTEQVITVFPQPDFSFVTAPDSGCSPLPVTFPFLNAQPPFPHFWDFGDGTTFTATAPGLVSHTYTNATTNNQIFQVSFTATSAFGCEDTSFVDVVVFPKPSADFSLSPDSGCTPLPVVFQNLSLGGDSTLWDFGDGDTSNSNAGTVNHTYSNFTSAAQNLTATQYIFTDLGCSDTATLPVEVNPHVIAGFFSDTIGCHPLVINFTDSSTNALVYDWDFGDGTLSSVNSPSHTFQNLTNNTVVYTVKLVVRSAEGCLDSVTQNITVFPKPLAQFTQNVTDGCHPLDLEFYDQSNLESSVTWLFGDGDSTNSLSDTILHTYINQTTDTLFFPAILYTESVNGCRDTAEQLITVYPEIIAGFVPSDTIGCHPLVLTFADTSTNTAVYEWDFGDGNQSSLPTPTHTFQNLTNNTVVYTVKMLVRSTEGCEDSVTQNITVYPKPLSQFTPSVNDGCHPLAVDFYDQSNLESSVKWIFDDGDSSLSLNDTIPHTFSNQTNDSLFFNVTLFVESVDGCLDTSSTLITVYPEIIAGFIPSDTIGCHPFEVIFDDTSNLPDVYVWDFGDGTPQETVANPTHIFENLTPNNVTYTVEQIVTTVEQCSDTATIDVLVYPKPTASFSSNTTVGCHPLEVDFYNLSVLDDFVIWDFADGDSNTTTNDTVTHIFTNTTNDTLFFDVQLIVETVNGCSDTVNQVITVYPEVIANFSASPTVGCSPLLVQFTDSSKNAFLYNWSFGDNSPGQISQNPFNTYVNPNTFTGGATEIYTVDLVITSTEGCQDSASLPITVFAKPDASFSAAPDQLCHGDPISFTNNSANSSVNYWYFGFNDTIVDNSAVVQQSFENTGTVLQFYTVTLITESVNGCLDTASSDVTIFPRIVSDFTPPDDGCHPHEVTFVNTSSGALQNAVHVWDFGDGNTEVAFDPTHTFENTTAADVTYNITLTSTTIFGCSSQVTFPITIHPTPVPDFIPSPVTQQFPDATVSFTNTTNAGPWDFNWDFGDTTFSTLEDPPDHTYNTWGTFSITLDVSSDFCSGTVTKEVQIIPPIPIPDFEGSGIGCRPVTIQFENKSIYGVTYRWDFGDGGSSSQENPLYSYFNVGTYDVTLTVTGPGGDERVLVLPNAVTVNEFANALFDFNPKTVTIPTQPVTFFNLSNFADTFMWDFGDGNTSTEENPEHFYTQAGSYTVTLIANNSADCPAEFEHPTQIVAQVAGDINVPNAFTPVTGGGNGGIFDRNSVANEVFFPILNGILEDDYELSIFNRWGELLFLTNETNRGWDGYYRGQLCQQDVYIWKIKAKLFNGQEVRRVGDVTLLR